MLAAWLPGRVVDVTRLSPPLSLPVVVADRHPLERRLAANQVWLMEPVVDRCVAGLSPVCDREIVE